LLVLRGAPVTLEGLQMQWHFKAKWKN